ncbi:gas vesicle protein [Streptomyces sp. HC44]|uniref:Gas vesicle protein n=1 Tax=Streptomyces scabichelini TaxID=2711217 RepID=A0A6G4V6S8_9ACTN|nr:gas vesicle protein [Streptomyces scabichelini]NGO09681.1 gas vesicle protein [Streptomyces scabichelini]
MSNTSNPSNTSNTSGTSSAKGSSEASEPSESSKGKQKSQADEVPGPMEVLRHARAQLAELTGMAAESVSSFERTEDGWTLEIEVMELARVPDTMSLLASYEVTLDPQGELTGYRRVRRYERGRADPHRPGGR